MQSIRGLVKNEFASVAAYSVEAALPHIAAQARQIPSKPKTIEQAREENWMRLLVAPIAENGPLPSLWNNLLQHKQSLAGLAAPVADRYLGIFDQKFQAALQAFDALPAQLTAPYLDLFNTQSGAAAVRNDNTAPAHPASAPRYTFN